MKSLSNISPFILLLVPVFMMMGLTLTNSSNHTGQRTEVSSKTTVNAPDASVKTNVLLSK